MLPVRLELVNFLAYRNPDPLLFEGIHLACLSGANGAGKSSVLDAITWVVWGKARTNSDDDLIHIGQDEMQVSLDFVQASSTYRIIRKRKRGKMRKSGTRSSGTSELNLFAFNEDDNVYRLLNEGSIRETQRRINELLSLDYDTFTNSAFLRQGQADSFTIKTPAQRKEILREILGLDRWGLYEEEVKARLKEIETRLHTIKIQLEEIEKEQAEEPALRESFKIADEEFHELNKLVEEAELEFEKFAGADNELKSARNERSTLVRTVEDQNKNIVDAQNEVDKNREKLEKYQDIISRQEDIQAGYEQLKDAQEANQQLGDMLQALRNVEKDISELEKEIDKERQAIDRERSQLETRLEQAHKQAGNIQALDEEFASVQQEIKDLEALEQERDDLNASTQELKLQKAEIETENKALRIEMDDIKERLDTIEQTNEANCPLCGQPLSEEHKIELIEDLETDGTSRGDKWRANKARIAEIDGIVKENDATVKDHGKAIAGLNKLRARFGTLEQQLKDAEKATDEIKAFEETLTELTERLEKQDFAHELQAQLKDLRATLDEMGYDADTHENIREQLTEFSQFDEQAKALEIALNTVEQIESSIENTLARMERWRETLAENEAKIKEIDERIEELEVKVGEAEVRRNELRRQRNLKRQAEEKVINYQQRLNAIEQQKERAEELKIERTQFQEEKSVYEELKLAFSRDGIPAMIIDAAIPELEETANRLLNKMTNGRMSVRFDTQRNLKSGGVAETFDIWISDELGQRDYSMYSGGEAFRVNFAIRVAISQLLARRAGAQLRTLFIDEGFGTQDEEGRARLTEAINAVQEDFDLILAITHIEELRDAFPVRIEIEKRDTGSVFMLR